MDVETLPVSLYFLIEVPADGENLAPWTKIGIATHVEWRKRNLRQGNPRELKFVRVYQFETARIAAAAEFAVQTEFQDVRSTCRPDWFRVSWQEVEHKFQALGYATASLGLVETSPA